MTETPTTEFDPTSGSRTSDQQVNSLLIKKGCVMNIFNDPT